MILRRVIEHVKHQSWTAVALDFVIVVVGVFVGLQVSNWNDARRERELERVYMQRLHDEAKAGLDGFLGYLLGALAPKFQAYQETVEILNDPDGPAALSDAQCDAIGNMHDFIAMPFQFPSLAEMTASGRLGVIRDASLRNALTQYRLTQDQNKAFIENLNTELVILPNAFPTYFSAHIANASAGLDLTYSDCDVAAMRADPRFRNSFADTGSRYNGYYTIVIEREIDSVRALHARLDAALSLSHGEAE